MRRAPSRPLRRARPEQRLATGVDNFTIKLVENDPHVDRHSGYLNGTMGTIIVDKVTDPTGDAQLFDFQVSHGRGTEPRPSTFAGRRDDTTQQRVPDARALPVSGTVRRLGPHEWDLREL